MPARALACVGLLLVTAAPVSHLWAQRTGDQARLIFTLWGGFVGGKDLWRASPQAVQFTTPTDSLTLARRIRSTLGAGFAGTYFPGATIGLAIESFLIGLGYDDFCSQVFSSGASAVTAACRSIQGSEKAATAVILSAGPVFRLNSRKLVSPYARISPGLVFSNQSSLRMSGQFRTPSGPADIIIYSDSHESRVEPSLALGTGFTASVTPSYQLRWEVRDNIVGVPSITNTIPEAGFIPPHRLEYKHLFSMTIGFDVVLERRRGRRY